jgi:hypothetical protein
MTDDNNKLTELCAQVGKEHDCRKLMRLTEEITRLLKAKEAEAKKLRESVYCTLENPRTRD